MVLHVPILLYTTRLSLLIFKEITWDMMGLIKQLINNYNIKLQYIIHVPLYHQILNHCIPNNDNK